jgi:nucleotide-binding universal stress UspA family protein
MRIVLPSDGSAGASAALNKLIGSFAGPGLIVDLLAVLDRRAGLGTAPEPEAVELFASERLRLEEAGIDPRVAVRTGHPAEEIVAFATSREADLIILGSRPTEGGGSGFSGSVASKVARYGHSSVLIARDGRPVRSIALGYDASPDADEALLLLARIPFRAPPKVAVCTVFEVPAPLSSGIAPTLRAEVWSARHAELEGARLAAEAIAGEAGRRLRQAGIEVHAHVAHGRASEKLVALAGEIGADLIVVGSRGLSGVKRFLLGSTSGELVAVAPTSLLVARS